jgi:hypothetical protein
LFPIIKNSRPISEEREELLAAMAFPRGVQVSFKSIRLDKPRLLRYDSSAEFMTRCSHAHKGYSLFCVFENLLMPFKPATH